MRVLVVEDEAPIAEAVAYSLKKEGYQPIVASTGELGLSMAKSNEPDLIILDLMLPGLGGSDVCRLIRRQSMVPIIILTAKAEVSDRISGLEIGADDYLSKPFSMRELMARVKTVLRRQQSAAQPKGNIISVGDLQIDLRKHEVILAGRPLELSRKEFGLLALLAGHPGQVFSRAMILDRVWGPDAYVEEHTVDVHIRWLRMKIEDDPALPRRILTKRGVGYKFSGDS